MIGVLFLNETFVLYGKKIEDFSRKLSGLKNS